MNENESLSAPEELNDSQRFESDTQKIVRKHLEDKEHIITDEEIRNVRVGMIPPESNEKNNGQPDENEPENLDNDGAKVKPADDPVTPWDTIEH